MGAGGADRLSRRFCFVSPWIVERNDIARLESRDEEPVDVGQEAFAIDGAVEPAGRVDMDNLLKDSSPPHANAPSLTRRDIHGTLSQEARRDVAPFVDGAQRSLAKRPALAAAKTNPQSSHVSHRA